MLRLGIVGCGRVTNMFHLRAINDVEGLEVVAVADRNQERIKEVQRKSGVDRGYIDYLELLTDPDVDVVAINTPPRFHEEMTIRSLKAGKHVVCEKPLAQSAEGCFHIEKVRKATGLKVLPVHNYFFTPCLETAEDLINNGEFGDLKKIYLGFENNLNIYGSKTDFRFTKFGIVEDILPHILSVLFRIAGPVWRVISATGRNERYDVLDNINLLMMSKSGVELDCFMSWTSLIPSFKMELFSSNGRINMELMKRPYRVELILPDGKQLFDKRGLGKYLDLIRLKHPGFKEMYRDLIRIIRGSENMRLSIEDEIEIIKIMEKTINLLK